MRIRAAVVSWALAWSCAAAAAATPVDVRVISRGAKFVGSKVGGARVVIADAITGEVLAQGVTEGGTGDTDLIMGRRGAPTLEVARGAAVFSASIDLAEPRRISITAHGPLGYPESANTVSATQWLLPGTAGTPGWILELPGLIVDPHDTPILVHRSARTASVNVHVTVRMMCGCPLTPDGIWDTDDFRIDARIVDADGREAAASALDYAGQPSEFEGTLTLDRPGTYQMSIRARQVSTANSGVARRTVIVD